MNTAMISIPSYQSALPLRQRVGILLFAVVAHAVLLAQPWLTSPELGSGATRELSVSLVGAQAPRNVVAVQQKKRVESEQKQAALVESQPSEVQAVRMDSAQMAAAGLPDREPDYRAAYLNNSQPVYPLAARRMGWQGRVMLEVEVLADGTAGEVIVQQSSGRDILDEAALRAVRSWRFIPAQVGGIAVTRRFQVPIAFNLT